MRDHVPVLREVFSTELRDRLARARQALDSAPSALAFDQLHQEFDSLHGAARAVNCPPLERGFRRLAEYARALRRRDAGDLPLHARRLLQEGIDITLGCAGHGGRCSGCPELEGLAVLIAKLETELVIDRGGDTGL